MATIDCTQLASKSSWDSQDFGDISMVLKMAHFCKSTGPRWVKWSWSSLSWHSLRDSTEIVAMIWTPACLPDNVTQEYFYD